MPGYAIAVCLLLLALLLGSQAGKAIAEDLEDHEEAARVFHNEWAVEVPGGMSQAMEVAKEYGFTFSRQVTNHCHFSVCLTLTKL